MTLALLSSVSFIAWFLSMVAGGGSPLILIPLVTVLFGAQAAAPILTIGLLVGNIQRTLFFWREIDWHITKWYVPGAILGAILGSYTLMQIRTDWVQLVVGCFLILMSLNYWLSRKQSTFPIKAWYFLPLAFLNAFGSGLIGSTGPILNPVYLNYGLMKERMIATKAAHVTLIHAVKLLTYLSLGAIDPVWMQAGLLMGLVAIPANWLGKLVLEHITGEQFRQIVLTFVGLSGVLMLWQQRNLLLLW